MSLEEARRIVALATTIKKGDLLPREFGMDMTGLLTALAVVVQNLDSKGQTS